ncbi:MAG: SDR family oxidoreductase [Betaproteobacteria bacterium]|nr:SDR family oxidoreductase [Betaproteobacteria bacterium]
MPTVLIAGASRGIGLELARQYAADGWHVIGTRRNARGESALRSAGAEPRRLDVSDASQFEALAASLAGSSLDLFIHSAGIYGPDTSGLAQPDEQAFEEIMRVNVLAAMCSMSSIGPLVARAGGRMVYLSSSMGSIAQMNGTYGWLYRTSKAALNAALKCTAGELGRRGVTCLALHPGWVRTDMGGPNASIDVVTSVTGMRRVIAAARKKDNGRFLDYTGAEIPW